MPPIYPFTAIVGQERMLRALVLNAVDPRIGGVLIRGAWHCEIDRCAGIGGPVTPGCRRQ